MPTTNEKHLMKLLEETSKILAKQVVENSTIYFCPQKNKDKSCLGAKNQYDKYGRIKKNLCIQCVAINAENKALAKIKRKIKNGK